MILEELDAQKLIISGVGVREGTFLHDMLRNHRGKIPNDINPSVKSLQDIFLTSVNDSRLINRHNRVLFALLKERFNLTREHLIDLEIAGKLYNIGANFNFYQAHKHSAYIALHSLNYGLSHRQRYTIATLLEYSHKKRPKDKDVRLLRLLPSSDILQILSFIFAISTSAAKDSEAEFHLSENTLCIKTNRPSMVAILNDITKPKLENGTLNLRVEYNG